ncbi:diacylglycerol kinase family protein [Amycolatopsis cynarae]|uniref:Diacylglycerol kinase family protein n=1 Tax=Amycolatopsis cynarae TaxID=2995223 RepID=A0ABY7AXF5_9PSEU|nr:diacylglycerol kinase family protein [Amycolatopsis sp. HUAS 11-8]WAL63308.1 diacylglycerol kinase family protein [Amycolatopsis sp. HUAS 11-8]
MRAVLAVHHGSGGGAAERLKGVVAARLRERVDRLELWTGDPAGAAGGDLLVVLGGDGAVHQAVQVCAGTGTALAVLPAGGGNDFARALGVPLDPLRALDTLLDALASGRRRLLDLGRADGRWFATVLCAGFDAAVARLAAALRWPTGPRRYDVAVVGELARFRPKPVALSFDGDRWELEATLVAVGNTGYYGGGIPVCPAANPGDGLFDITVVGRASRADLIRLLPRLRTGAHLAHPAVRTVRAREVLIEGNDWPVVADGEPAGTVPVSVRCVPGALTVVL